jgi:hypothetical protein
MSWIAPEGEWRIMLFVPENSIADREFVSRGLWLEQDMGLLSRRGWGQVLSVL